MIVSVFFGKVPKKGYFETFYQGFGFYKCFITGSSEIA